MSENAERADAILDIAARISAALDAAERRGMERAAEVLFAAIPDKVHPDLAPADEHGWSLGVRYMAAYGAAAIRTAASSADPHAHHPVCDFSICEDSETGEPNTELNVTADAAFIAASREAVPDMLDAIRSLRRALTDAVHLSERINEPVSNVLDPERAIHWKFKLPEDPAWGRLRAALAASADWEESDGK